MVGTKKDTIETSLAKKAGKVVLNATLGSIPFGGILAAFVGAYNDHQQERASHFLKGWIQMLEDELKEKAQTITEIMARLDLQDEKINERITSQEYQSLLKKAFREWAATESEEKRVYVRNILANAAVRTSYTYDVIRLFLSWIGQYSELHFKVIRAIYNKNGISRGEIWVDEMKRAQPREDSADADLYKLIIRDLSTGGIIRQHKDVDWQGNYIIKQKAGIKSPSSAKLAVSAFDRNEKYELTSLGNDFIHYAVGDLPLKISFNPTSD